MAQERMMHLWRSQTRRDQFLAVLVGSGCLFVSYLLQGPMTAAMRGDATGERPRPALVVEGEDAHQSFRSMAVTFPRLTLGGFRGLISTVLWWQAEEDKNEHKWQDLETKYIIIGNLQPYFATVYDYHSWNLAYNLSAQWHTEDSKYKWVLDGMSYLYKGESYIPRNAFLIWKEGDMYFMKLGGAFERSFYREHWRADLARLHELNDADVKARVDDSTEGLRHVQAFVVAAPPENARAYFHVTPLADPEGGDGTGWGVSVVDPNPKEGEEVEDADGKRHLIPPNIFKYRADNKQPQDPVMFRYGLSVFYFAYIEYRRSLDLGGPGNLNPKISDAWPAMCLRLWCRDDVYYTGQEMKRLFGEAPDTALLADNKQFNMKIAEINDCRRNVEMIAPAAVEQFEMDIGKYSDNKLVHQKHIEETLAAEDAELAEGKLFDALVQWHLNGRDMNKTVNGVPILDMFKAALPLYETAIAQTVKWADVTYPPIEGLPMNPDRGDIIKYATAMKTRELGIQAMLQLAPGAKPDMSFLNDEVVEK